MEEEKISAHTDPSETPCPAEPEAEAPACSAEQAAGQSEVKSEADPEEKTAAPPTEPSPDEAPVSTEAAPNTAPPSKKKAKIIALVIAVAAVVVIAVATFFISNAGEDASAQNAIREDLAAKSAIEEQVIPSQWGDQKDFSLRKAHIDDFERNPLRSPDMARAHLTAVADNGYYEMVNEYDVIAKKDNGQWLIDSLEPTYEYYHPISEIPDEMIAENSDKIFQKADEYNAEIYTVNPRNLGELFGEDTHVEVTENNWAKETGDRDDIEVVLTTVRDGVEYTGDLALLFAWSTSLPDGPDWVLSSAVASEDTYYAIGSFPHPGLSSDISEFDAEEAAKLETSWDKYWLNYLTRIYFNADKPYGLIDFENIASNNVDLEFSIIRNDTGETIYESPRIEPDMSLDTIRLDEPLEEGEYRATIKVVAYDEGSNSVVGKENNPDITLIVE